MRRRFAIYLFPVAFAGQSLCGQLAQADTVSILGFNIASTSIQGKTAAGPGFTGIHDTGDLLISATGSTSVDIDVDGKKKATLTDNAPATPSFDLTGKIHLSNGNISGGLITLIANEVSGTETYQFNVAPGSGSLHKIPFINSYLLAGLTYNGLFNNSSFGGVDVSFWQDQQPVLGSFLQFNYNPDSRGYDQSANLDVAVFGEQVSTLATPQNDQILTDGNAAVPLPNSLWGGALLLAAVGASRFRNRANSL
jgi:hypothetical protein